MFISHDRENGLIKVKSDSKKNDIDTFEDLQIAYEGYSLAIERLQHFNHLQTTYKTFAFTWIAATFFAIGYSLSAQEVNLPLHPLIIVSALCIASSIGIILIWYMDLILCERMIATALFEALDYEEKHDWIPKIHQTSNLFHKLWGYVHIKDIFYTGCIGILYITMSLSLAFYVNKIAYYITFPIASILATTGFLLVSSSLIKKINPYERLKSIKRRNNGK